MPAAGFSSDEGMFAVVRSVKVVSDADVDSVRPGGEGVVGCDIGGEGNMKALCGGRERERSRNGDARRRGDRWGDK